MLEKSELTDINAEMKVFENILEEDGYKGEKLMKSNTQKEIEELVKNETNITETKIENSLNYDNSLCATPASNPEFHGMFDEYQDAFENVSSLEEVKSLKLADMFNGDEYLEFQIHGTSAHAMNSQNIKEIIFSKEPSESLVKKLNAKNIKYRVI